MNTNPLIDKFGAPGRVLVGNASYLSNWPMSKVAHAREIGLNRPDILRGLYQHFAGGTGMMSEMMMYMGMHKDPDYDNFMEKNWSRYISPESLSMDKSFKVLNNMEFAWQSPSPSGWLYRIVSGPAGDVDGLVGRGGAEFTIVLNVQLGDKDDVILLADGNTQLIITRAPEATPDGNLKCRVRILYAPGQHGKGIPAVLVSARKEAKIIYNIKPEASEHGSKTLVRFGEWHRGWMTCMRWEYNITGHAAHIKQDNEKMAILYLNHAGNVEPYLIEVWRYNMLKTAYEAMDNQMFWGLDYTDKNGRFIKDERGYPYYSGLGMYHQTNKRNRRDYDTLNDFTIIDDILINGYYGSLETGVKNTWLLCAGMQLRSQFDKLLRKEFPGAHEVLFYDGVGNYQMGQGSGKKTMGLRSNFTYYEIPAGTIIVADCPYFDNTNMPSLKTIEGHREQSYRGLFINFTKLNGGQHPISMVTLSGRKNVMGRVVGMSKGGNLTTTADVEGEHFLTMQGCAVHNPNCIAELTRIRSNAVFGY